jgi:hypothetical protein
MNAKPLSNRQEIIEHLDRATELGVSLKDYADAYDVNLKNLTDARAMIDKPKPAPLSVEDFVKVEVARTPPCQGVVCSLSHPAGWTLQCNEWPPTAWLAALGSVEG